MHVWPIEALPGCSDQLRTEWARCRARNTSISRVLNAMYNRGLSMMTVGGALGIDGAVSQTP